MSKPSPAPALSSHRKYLRTCLTHSPHNRLLYQPAPRRHHRPCHRLHADPGTGRQAGRHDRPAPAAQVPRPAGLRAVRRVGAAAPAGASLTPPKSSHVQAQPRSETMPSERQFVPRSRTPDPEHSFSYGAPLMRYPTCPVEETLGDRKGTLTVKERQAARAQKLAKMGFSSGGEPWREVSTYSRSNRQRFGGIKTLVQSLTGRA